MSRKEGGKRTYQHSRNVDASIQRLEDYIEKRGGRLITATRNDTDNMRISRTKITRKQKWEEKQLYGRFKRHLTRENLDVAKKGNLTRETKPLLIAVQNNAIRTNHIKAGITHICCFVASYMQQNSRCGLCDDRDETINPIISECSKLAQKEYKTRHDLGGDIH